MVSRETFDDIFDDEGDDEIIHRKEWNKVSKELQKGGYRDGLDTGQEVTLQAGFNHGYTQGVTISQKLGCLRGKLSAHLSIRKLNPEENDAISNLIKKILKYEKELTAKVKSHPYQSEMNSSQQEDGQSNLATKGCSDDGSCQNSRCENNGDGDSETFQDRTFQQVLRTFLAEAETRYLVFLEESEKTMKI